MFREEIGKRLLVTVIWLTMLNFLRLAAGRWDWYWLLFWLGAGLGTFLMDLDAWLDRLVLNPQNDISQEIKKLVRAKKYQQAYNWLLDAQQRQIRLAFRSALFQLVLVIFCFWALTSTGSWLGKGLVMALYLQLGREVVELRLRNQDQFLRQRLFSIFKKTMPARAETFWVIGFVLAFLVLNLLLI